MLEKENLPLRIPSSLIRRGLILVFNHMMNIIF